MFDQEILQALGNLGEFVGALGVVFSMIYLAKEMKQNTISVRAASFNEMVQNSIRLSEHAFRDSEFADFLDRAQRDSSVLTPAERVRWDAYMTAVFRHFGNLVYQYRVGALDQQMWESYARTLEDHLRRTPSWLAWFDANRSVFSTSLVEQVDGVHAVLEAERKAGSAGRAVGGAEGVSPPPAIR